MTDELNHEKLDIVLNKAALLEMLDKLADMKKIILYSNPKLAEEFF